MALHAPGKPTHARMRIGAQVRLSASCYELEMAQAILGNFLI